MDMAVLGTSVVSTGQETITNIGTLIVSKFLLAIDDCYFGNPLATLGSSRVFSTVTALLLTFVTWWTESWVTC